MNLFTTLSIYGYGTHEGLLKSWDTRGRGRKAIPGGETAARYHEEADFWDKSPGSRRNPISCGNNLKRAAKLIAEGKHITLDQPDQITTLIAKMKKDADIFHKEGKPLPNFNIANISIRNRNLFAMENVGIPRVDMPQLAGWVDPGSPASKLLPKNAPPDAEVDLAPEFIKELKDSGVDVHDETVQASHLRSTQEELDGFKVASIAARIEAGKMPEVPIFVTRDNYILDGHHRWAGMIVEDAKNNRMGDITMPVHKLDIDIGTALTRALDFQKKWGISKAKVSYADKQEWLPEQQVHFGGEGSGCKGPNCGRPSEQSHGALKMPRGRQTIKRIDKELKEAALNKKVVLLEYNADNDPHVKAKSYVVEPYSYRQRGKDFYFFGYDQSAKSIKAFNINSIIRVSPLGKSFKPRWPVEIGKKDAA